MISKPEPAERQPRTFGGRSTDAHIDDDWNLNKGRAMRKYEFTLVLRDAPHLTEELADELFAAGCDDGTPRTCDGVFSIDFHREAGSLEAAIHSAIKSVNAASCDVARVEIDAGTVQPA